MTSNDNLNDLLIRAYLMAILATVAVFICVLSYLIYVIGSSYGDPFLQRNFPCHEDAALVYSRTDADRVECVTIDDRWVEIVEEDN